MLKGVSSNMREKIIKEISKISEDEQIEYIKRGHDRIGFIINPSERVQVESIRINKNCIYYIDNLCELAQEEFIKGWDYKYELGVFLLAKIKSKRVLELYKKLKMVNGIIK